MDRNTLLKHRSLWVDEPEEKRFTDELKNLTVPEQELFTALRSNLHRANVRLEQERIQHDYVSGCGFECEGQVKQGCHICLQKNKT